jgi:N-acetylmuramoyl-L-alanine amidase
MRENIPQTFPQPRGPISSLFFQLQMVFIVAFLVATLFTAATPSGLIPSNISDLAQNAPLQPDTSQEQANQPPLSSQPRIGIVAGHWGNDSGAVCQDGLTELEINLSVATLVKQQLNDLGYEVDLLKEFDPLLEDYYANALVSIHADSCEYVNDQATGFKVAAALRSRQTQNDRANRLTACLRARYQEATGLALHNSVTNDMTLYHAFDEISADTIAAIIEVGFLNLDRQILTQSQDKIADGVVRGILCYLNNEDVNTGN